MQVRFVIQRIGLPIFFALVLAFNIPAGAQQTLAVSDPDDYLQLQEAIRWFEEGKYAIAYPKFADLQRRGANQNQKSRDLEKDAVAFYMLACELMNNSQTAEAAATAYLNSNASEPYKAGLAYYLGNYYFQKGQNTHVIKNLEQVNLDNLDEEKAANLAFMLGYSYFSENNYSKAEPQFNAVRGNSASQYYTQSNYYYGILAYQKKRYREALSAFNIAKSNPDYAKVIPFYEISILYVQGQKEKALSQAEQYVGKATGAEKILLMKLIGHAYFEKGQFDKAQPYLDYYITKSSGVSREDLYELAYTHYAQKRFNEAILQFKPLAGGQDSLSQHAMYLLGDAYLEMGDKPNARTAFLFSSDKAANPQVRETSLFTFGKLSFELGLDNESLIALKKYTTQYPNGVYKKEANEILVAVLANTSNYKEALEVYNSLPEKSVIAEKSFPAIAFNRAQELLNDKQTQEAEVLFQKLNQQYPSTHYSALASFWRGEIFFGKNETEQAITQFKQYLTNPITAGEATPANARYSLGYAYLRLKKYSEAATEFLAIQSSFANNTTQQQDVNLRLADSWFMQKNYSKAYNLYSQIANQTGEGADYAKFQKAMILGAQNKATEKITTLRTIETSSQNPALIATAQMEIADTYLAEERFVEAIPFLDKIIANPTISNLKPDAYLKSGLAFYNLNDNSKSLLQFNELIKRYPATQQAEEALDNMRSIYVEMGKTEEYVQLLNKLGKGLNAAVADSLSYATVELQLSEGRKEDAMKSLLAYLKNYPNGRYALIANYQAAELLAEKADMPAAIPYYEAVASRAPNKYAVSVLTKLARYFYFDKKDYSRASGYYKNLLQVANSDAEQLEALRGLVRTHYYVNDFIAGDTYARKILSLGSAGNDDKIFAYMIVGKKQMQDKQYNEAILQFKQAAKISKAEIGAEARYRIAECWYLEAKLAEAEKASFETIKQSGSYEYWVTKSYLLLGNIFLAQKDYFNAKATFKSVAENTTIEELRVEANTKLAEAEKASASESKIK